MTEKSSPPLEEAIQALASRWLPHPLITGIARGCEDTSPCIVIYLLKNDTALIHSLPSRYQGYPVTTQLTGSFMAHTT